MLQIKLPTTPSPPDSHPWTPTPPKHTEWDWKLRKKWGLTTVSWTLSDNIFSLWKEELKLLLGGEERVHFYPIIPWNHIRRHKQPGLTFLVSCFSNNTRYQEPVIHKREECVRWRKEQGWLVVLWENSGDGFRKLKLLGALLTQWLCKTVTEVIYTICLCKVVPSPLFTWVLILPTLFSAQGFI